MDIWRKRLRERLRIKSDQGVPTNKIAEQIGISASRLYNYTSTMREPQSFKVFCDLCRALDTHPSYLLGFSDDPKWPPEEVRLSDLAAKIDALTKSRK